MDWRRVHTYQELYRMHKEHQKVLIELSEGSLNGRAAVLKTAKG